MILYCHNFALHKVSYDAVCKEGHFGLSLAKDKGLILRDGENWLHQSSPGVSEVLTEVSVALSLNVWNQSGLTEKVYCSKSLYNCLHFSLDYALTLIQ